MTTKTRSAPDFSNLPPVHASAFRRFAEMSEVTLLDMLWTMADADDVASLITFVSEIQANGSPGAIYANNTKLSPHPNGKSYPNVFVHALRSQSTDFSQPMPWTVDQHILFSHLMEALQSHPEREGFIRDMAEAGAIAVQEKRFFEGLADALGPLNHRLVSERSERRMVGLLEHAVLNGNSAAASALASLVVNEQVVELLDRLCMMDEKKNLNLAQAILEMSPDNVRETLTALECQASEELMGNARFALLDKYLLLCLNSESPWTRETLNILSGNNGLDASFSRLGPAIEAQVDALKLMGSGVLHPQYFSSLTTVSAMGNAIATHCTPLLDVLSPVVTAWRDPANKQPNLFDMGKLVVQSHESFSDPIWNVEDFKDCFHLMQRCGHDPNNGRGAWASLFHALAHAPLQAKHCQKFVALLDLGLDPSVRDEDDKTAMETLEPEIGNQWQSIAISHRARNAAHDILNDIQGCPKTKTAP